MRNTWAPTTRRGMSELHPHSNPKCGSLGATRGAAWWVAVCEMIAAFVAFSRGLRAVFARVMIVAFRRLLGCFRLVLLPITNDRI